VTAIALAGEDAIISYSAVELARRLPDGASLSPSNGKQQWRS